MRPVFISPWDRDITESITFSLVRDRVISDYNDFFVEPSRRMNSLPHGSKFRAGISLRCEMPVQKMASRLTEPAGTKMGQPALVLAFSAPGTRMMPG